MNIEATGIKGVAAIPTHAWIPVIEHPNIYGGQLHEPGYLILILRPDGHPYVTIGPAALVLRTAVWRAEDVRLHA